jgi:hypothetical protein
MELIPGRYCSRFRLCLAYEHMYVLMGIRAYVKPSLAQTIAYSRAKAYLCDTMSIS